jgi:hypothetical protein
MPFKLDEFVRIGRKGKMKRNHFGITLMIAGISLLFIVATTNAQEAGKGDVLEMKNTKAFAEHKQAIVMFTHKKHSAAKPEGYGVGCGECHHDKDGKPLANLKATDKVQGCFECHAKPDKPKKEQGMTDADWKKLNLSYYYGAIHENCISCHKTGGKGPVKCAECHPKPEKAAGAEK